MGAGGPCGGAGGPPGGGGGATAAADVGGVGDFIDIIIDAEGRPWVSYVDTCVAACRDDPKMRYDEDAGAVGTTAPDAG